MDRRHVGDCMSAANIVVGKPGGLTVAESLARRPAAARDAVAARTGRFQRVRFLERNGGVGRLVSDDDVPAQVEALLQNEGELQACRCARCNSGVATARRRSRTVRSNSPTEPEAMLRQGRSAELLRRAVRGVLEAVDAIYRRAFRLQPVGSVLFVGVAHRAEALPERSSGASVSRRPSALQQRARGSRCRRTGDCRTACASRGC